MNKNLKLMKKIFVISCCLLFIFVLSYNYFVEATASALIKNQYKGTISGDGVKDAAPKVKKIIGTILSLVRTASAGVAIVMIIVLACKYIIASAGDRADIKKSSVSYVIGAIILFSASVLVSIIKNAVDDAVGD